jgi:hypothetical protein
MVSNILHRISKKGKTLLRQLFSRPAQRTGSVRIVIRESSWKFVISKEMGHS